jgi:hypothetical protein
MKLLLCSRTDLTYRAAGFTMDKEFRYQILRDAFCGPSAFAAFQLGCLVEIPDVLMGSARDHPPDKCMPHPTCLLLILASEGSGTRARVIIALIWYSVCSELDWSSEVKV